MKKLKDWLKNNISKGLKKAYLGIHEDWFWTALPFWEKEEFNKQILEKEVVAGLKGSSWGTPTLNLIFDENEKMISCYIGESSKSGPPINLLGTLSEPIQRKIPKLENG